VIRRGAGNARRRMAWSRPRPAHGGGHHRHRHRLARPLIRFLRITRRRVVASGAREYALLWRAVSDAVSANDGRAWIFVHHAASEFFIEFVEWQSSGNEAIIDRAVVRAALRDLDAAFPSEDSETWKEATL
jgi:hypothetical protein